MHEVSPSPCVLCHCAPQHARSRLSSMCSPLWSSRHPQQRPKHIITKLADSRNMSTDAHRHRQAGSAQATSGNNRSLLAATTHLHPTHTKSVLYGRQACGRRCCCCTRPPCFWAHLPIISCQTRIHTKIGSQPPEMTAKPHTRVDCT